MSDPTRREAVLAEAVRAGKFPAHRVPHYRREYDRDPAGTEALIAALYAVGGDVLGHSRAAARVEPGQAQHPHPVVPAAEVELDAEQVGAWSRQLFPEAVAAGSKPGRITADAKYSRVRA
jgi:hypothetical protein